MCAIGQNECQSVSNCKQEIFSCVKKFVLSKYLFPSFVIVSLIVCFLIYLCGNCKIGVKEKCNELNGTVPEVDKKLDENKAEKNNAEDTPDLLALRKKFIRFNKHCGIDNLSRAGREFDDILRDPLRVEVNDLRLKKFKMSIVHLISKQCNVWINMCLKNISEMGKDSSEKEKELKSSLLAILKEEGLVGKEADCELKEFFLHFQGRLKNLQLKARKNVLVRLADWTWASFFAPDYIGYHTDQKENCVFLQNLECIYKWRKGSLFSPYSSVSLGGIDSFGKIADIGSSALHKNGKLSAKDLAKAEVIQEPEDLVLKRDDFLGIL